MPYENYKAQQSSLPFMDASDKDSHNKRDVSDYALDIERTPSDDPTFSAYVRQLSAAMRFLDSVDPYTKNPYKALDTKIDQFLRAHANRDYRTFLQESHPEKITTNDYARLSKDTLKKRLFAYRTKLHLAALADLVEQGHDLPKVLIAVRARAIPYVKKETTDDPTFQKILEALESQR